MQYIKDFCE